MLKIVFIAAFTLTACASAPSPAQSAASVPTPRIKPAPITAPAPDATTPASQPEVELSFEGWKQDFIARATAKGYNEDFVRSVIGPAKINRRAIKKDNNQAEVTKPFWSYVDLVDNAARLQGGQAKLAAHTDLFDDLETRYGIDRHIITAIWGLESAYGKIMGDENMVDSLATLAYDGRRRAFFESQLYAVMDMLASGEVRMEQLVGSWAGAMGMTQFIPTTFRDYAVDYNNNGNKDLWGDTGDAMASTASYLERFGWRRTEPIVAEVILPEGFSYGLSDGTKRTVSGWSGMGVRPVGGQAWPNDALFLEAKLLIPAGIHGPTFLTFKNFDVIKKYNNSTKYALGITVLAGSLQGQKTITRDWPRADKPLSFDDKKALQGALTRQGYDTNGVDGRLGPNSYRAIRAWQKANGLPADGYVEQRLLKKILGS